MSRLMLLPLSLLLACQGEPTQDTAALTADADGDGFDADADCDDANPDVHPDATEVCNGVDDDCNGLIDDSDPGLDLTTAGTWYLDLDGDGAGRDESLQTCQAPPGHVDHAGDCDDTDPAVHPLATEVCDGVDDDCDTLVDDEDDDLDLTTATTYYTDGDGDGWGDAATELVACDAPDGTVTRPGDCDDARADVAPEHADVCGDGVDNDCDPTDVDDCGIVGALSLADADVIVSGIHPDHGMIPTLMWAGDANGDGYDDVGLVAQAPDTANGYLITGPLVPGHYELETLYTASYQDMNPTSFEWDVDRDGSPDLLLSNAGSFASGYSWGGAMWVTDQVRGDVLEEEVHTAVYGTQWGMMLYPAGYGDVTGDGAADIVLSATYHDNGPVYDGSPARGGAYVIDSALPSGSWDVDEVGWFIGGPETDSRAWVSSVVDATGDGVDDILFVYDGDLSAGTYELALVPGPVTAATTFDDAVATLSLSDVYLYSTFATWMDLDSDGQEDLVVGTPWADDYNGTTYGFLGPISGDLTLADADVVIHGGTVATSTGSMLRSPGDLDGDGNADLVMSGTNTLVASDDPRHDAGESFLFYGPILAGEYRVEEADAQLTGTRTGELAGRDVAPCGDVNADGYDDLLIGSRYSYPEDGGRIYIVFGGPRL